MKKNEIIFRDELSKAIFCCDWVIKISDDLTSNANNTIFETFVDNFLSQYFIQQIVSILSKETISSAVCSTIRYHPLGYEAFKKFAISEIFDEPVF